MSRLLPFIVLIVMLLASAACTRRMAPFAPHRPNSEAHRAVQGNHGCQECHPSHQLGGGHQPSDDCLKCHRILQGD